MDSKEMLLLTEDPGNEIKRIMDDEGVTQTELARRMQINRQSIQQSLTRKSKNMRVQTLLKILGSLGYDVWIRKR